MCSKFDKLFRSGPTSSNKTRPQFKYIPTWQSKVVCCCLRIIKQTKKNIITNQTKPYEFAVEEVEALQRQRLKNMSVMENQQQQDNKGQLKKCERKRTSCYSRINNLDDGCLMHIFSFLPPIPGITFFFQFFV